MASNQYTLQWSSAFSVTPPQRTPKLPGDKIILPQSALEQLLAVAPLQRIPEPGPSRSYTTAFDPFNPHTFATESLAREEGLQRQHQLPHPLTFRVVNSQNNRAIYAGIREFSAEENELGLSTFLRDALGIDDDEFPLPANGATPLTTSDNAHGDVFMSVGREPAPTVTVHAIQLPRGNYVRLRPLEAGYDPEDWKALLERYMRDNHTTLSTGAVLTVPGGRNESFRFLVDKVAPEGDGICVVDTDLEVDIVALTEEQARETLQKSLERASRAPGTKGGTSLGGVLGSGEVVSGQVVPGEYVDYELQDWDRGKPISMELNSIDDSDVYIFASPFSYRQRNRPRDDEHVFSDLSGRPSKRIWIPPANVNLEEAESLYLSVHAFAPFGTEDPGKSSPHKYELRVIINTCDPVKTFTDEEPNAHNAEDVQCQNCHQWVPQQTLMLHENFCLRNNIHCPQCDKVFQKKSSEWQTHWHCPHDTSYGNDESSKRRHDFIFHTSTSCSACGFEAMGLPGVAQHRTTSCPSKPILCQFCHLVVPQQGDSDPELQDPEVLLSGLTPHELVDGGRTTECHLCSKIVRLRDMKTHLRHHDLERLSRPTPRVCLNHNCGRVLDGRGAQNASTPRTETLGLCSICFGPLYVDTYDPDGKAFRRRIERRYLSQIMTGCGKPWCQNAYCKTGKQNRSDGKMAAPASISAASILTEVRPMVDALHLTRDVSNTAPFYFCTDQVSQQRRTIAEMIAAENPGAGEKAYELPWCVAAVEATGGNIDNAREWLEGRAPAKGENTRAF